MYDSSVKYKWDNKNMVDHAREEGERKKRWILPASSKKGGLSIEFIAETIGLTIEEVETL
jgi:hypothetical protein